MTVTFGGLARIIRAYGLSEADESDPMKTADIVIVGGGIIGVSIAHHLLERDPRLAVVLLEKESEVGTGSTSKATGGVRHQFSTEPNIRLTRLSYRYFTEAEAILGRPVDFVAHGYLFVTADRETARRQVSPSSSGSGCRAG